MLPNIRLSGSANTPIDLIGDFLGASSASDRSATAAAVVANSVNRTNASGDLANRYAAVAASAGWGNSTILDSLSSARPGALDGGPGEANKTLAYYVKESASLQSALSQQQQQQQLHRQASSANNNHTTSLPWAAAVKAAEQQQFNVASNQPASAFDRNNTIGSWSSPETSSSARSGWNADGSLKGDGVPDDGTAIWGNPTTKKAGIDWAEKESLLTSEKRIQKAEPTISSINGTEAWGAPPPAGGTSSSSLTSKTVTNSQQQSKSNENSGNIYETKTIKNEQSQLNPCSLGITPSRDLLKQMVHQIQLAVQAGHLNAQILNQPMSTPTLQLVYTLLQQIKLLQQYQELQSRSANKLDGRNSPNNLDHQINRVQQNISLLHKAITQQQAASSSLNIGSGIDNLIEKNTGNSFCGKMDNGDTDKIGGDAFNFLRSNDIQRSPPALYEWGSIGSSSMQYSSDPAPIGSKQSSNSNNGNRMSSTAALGSNSRPAPPPGLMSNFGSIIGAGCDEPQLPSLDSSANLWSGTWFD